MEISSTGIKLFLLFVIFATSEYSRRGMYYDTNPFIQFSNTGMGDSIVIKAQKGALILVDGGPDKSVLSKLSDLLPMESTYIDYVIVSHPHADHIQGLIYVLNEYSIGCIIYNYNVKPASLKDSILKKVIRTKNIPNSFSEEDLSQCHISELDSVKILFPPITKRLPKNVNDLSLLLLYNQNNKLFVLTGDAEYSLQNYYLNRIKNLESWNPDSFKRVILKIPHQGSRDSLNPLFTGFLKPDTGIILVGGNSYGHPHKEVIDYYEGQNIKLFRSDLDGDIRFEN